MPKLIAAALEDGWGFVDDGEGIISIKPPYNRCDALTISHAAIREAVQMYGFDVIDKDFDDWQSLITFLETEMVQIRRASGQTLPPDFGRLVKFASKETILQYLDRIEVELFANREWTAALNILTSMLNASNLTEDPQLLGRTAALLKRSNDELRHVEITRRIFVERENLDQRFPNAVEYYGADTIREYAKGISRRKTVFAMSA
jgi:hypothetical protein